MEEGDLPTMDGKQRSRVFFEQMLRKVSYHRIGLTEAFALLDVRKGLKTKARGRGQ